METGYCIKTSESVLKVEGQAHEAFRELDQDRKFYKGITFENYLKIKKIEKAEEKQLETISALSQKKGDL